MKQLKSVLLLLGFSFPLFTQAQQNFDTVQIKTHQITDNIYYLEGAGGNIGVLTGPDGTILIDDQFAPLTPKIKAAIAKLTNEPVRFVINTHLHGDHTGGNENLGKEGAIIVAHENTRKRLSVDQFNATFKTTTKAYPYDALPKVTFSESVTLHLNGQTLEIYHVKNAHTDGDIIIHFKEANVYHTGDVFVRYGLPFIDQGNGGSFTGMIEANNLLASRINDQAKIIPGHGDLAQKKDLVAFRNMLVTIRERVAESLKKGKTDQEIINEDPTKEFTARFDRSAFVMMVLDSMKK